MWQKSFTPHALPAAPPHLSVLETGIKRHRNVPLMAGLDIPLYKLNNSDLQVLFKYVGQKAPFESACQKQIDNMGRGAGVCFQGGKFEKKGTPTKVVYSNHVAIKLAYSLKNKVFACSRSLIFLFLLQNHIVL